MGMGETKKLACSPNMNDYNRIKRILADYQRIKALLTLVRKAHGEEYESSLRGAQGSSSKRPVMRRWYG